MAVRHNILFSLGSSLHIMHTFLSHTFLILSLLILIIVCLSFSYLLLTYRHQRTCVCLAESNSHFLLLFSRHHRNKTLLTYLQYIIAESTSERYLTTRINEHVTFLLVYLFAIGLPTNIAIDTTGCNKILSLEFNVVVQRTRQNITLLNSLMFI